MKKISIILLIICVLVIQYIVGIYNTNIIIDDFKNVITGEFSPQEVKQPEFRRYDIKKYHKNIEGVNVSVKRILVCCGLKSGFMLVKYTYESFDEKNTRVNGSWDIFSMWYLKNTNGKWVVTEIKERP